MRCDDIPNFKRCCMCIPLRLGILIFGYLNMILSILIIILQITIDWNHDSLSTITIANFRGVTIFVQAWLPHILNTMEVLFNIVLLVGAHTKRQRLIRAYYYYGLMTTVATVLLFVVIRCIDHTQEAHWFRIDFCFVFSGFVIHVYLLLLIRTEMQKLKEQTREVSYLICSPSALILPSDDTEDVG